MSNELIEIRVPEQATVANPDRGLLQLLQQVAVRANELGLEGRLVNGLDRVEGYTDPKDAATVYRVFLEVSESAIEVTNA